MSAAGPIARVAAVAVVGVLALCLPVPAAPAAAKEHFPAFTAPVVDQAGAVPDELESRVNAGLIDYQRRSGNQVAAAVVGTTGNQSIEDYTIDLARAWGVGEKGEDNGVLLLIALRDRRLRIEVGGGLEGELTDLESSRIIRERIVPLLRENRVGEAVVQGTDAIRRDLGDTQVGQLPPRPVAAPRQAPASGSLGGLVFLVLMGFMLFSLFGRRRRRRSGWGMPILWGGGWGGGFGGGGFGAGGFGSGGGFGGGGFGGGGGGGFSGGGASGDW